MSLDRQRDLIKRLEVRGAKASIEMVAKYLYEMRSNFVHGGKLVLHMSEGISVDSRGKKWSYVICQFGMP